MMQRSANQASRKTSASSCKRRLRFSRDHILRGMSQRVHQIEINRFLRVPLIAANEHGGVLNQAVGRLRVPVRSQNALGKILPVPATAESHDGIGEVVFIRSRSLGKQGTP